MAKKITCMAAAIAVAAIFLVATTVQADDEIPIPADKSQVSKWFKTNIKTLAHRKGTMNATLEAIEAKPKVFKVRPDGSGDFKTLTDAFKEIPTGNSERTIFDLGSGTVFHEKVVLDRSKPFVTLIGDPKNMPKLTFNGTAHQFGTVYSATLQVDSDFFMAANIIIENSAPKPDGKSSGQQAVALRIGGDKSSFYNVRLLGFQDTLCDDRGKHFFKDCYIEGTVDFIFGSGTSLYVNTELFVINDPGYKFITAQARALPDEQTGFSFVHCNITGNATGAFLGRAWMEAPRVAFSYCDMGPVVNPEGWSLNFHPDRKDKVVYLEYKNRGPGADPSKRAKFSKQLTDAQAKPYISLGFITGTRWLLPPPKY